MSAGLPCAKNRTLIAIDSPKCSPSTTNSSTLLVCRSVALNTGKRLRSRKNTDTPNPTPTKTQLRMVMGDQLISATGIQIRLAYPYRAQHSRRLALSEPKYRSAR